MAFPSTTTVAAFGPGTNDARFKSVTPTMQAPNGLAPAQRMTRQATRVARQPVRQDLSAARGYTSQAAAAAPAPTRDFGAVAGTNTQPAAQQYGAATGVATQRAQPAADTNAARAAISTRLNAVAAMPDRVQQAQDAFRLVRESGQSDYDQAVRDVGRDAAKFGRIGSGMTSSKVGDLFAQRQSSLDRTASELAQNAAAQQRQDQLDLLGATQGVAGDLFGQDTTLGNQDLSRADFLAGMGDRSLNLARTERGDAVDERAFAAQRGDTRNAQQMSVAELMAQLGGQEAGFAQSDANFSAGRQDAQTDALFRGAGLSQSQAESADAMARADRGELRTERDYQVATERDAFNRDLARRQTEEDLLNSQFAREMQMRQLLASLGFGN